MPTINRLMAGCALLGLLAGAVPAQAVDYPARAVTLITAGSPGSGPDVMARVVADRLSQSWGQQAVVLNRPGAAGLTSLQAAGSAAPDGYTLYVGFASMFVVFPEAQPHLAPDLRRLVPVGLVGDQPMVIAVSPKLGANSLADLLQQARDRPGHILYGGFRATMPHLAAALLTSRAKADLRFIPSTGPRAVQDVLEGSLHVAVEGMGAMAGLIQSGLLKPLAVAAQSRLPDYPALPTVGESVPELAGFEARGWLALFAPVGTPDTVVEKISRDLRAALADPETARKLTLQGVYPKPLSPAETADFIRREQDLWRPTVRQLELATR